MNILQQLSRQPEYFHVLINPLPIYGLALGLLGVIVAIALRSRPAQIATLIIVFLSALSAWPVFELGEEGFDPVLSMSDEPGQAWLKAHRHRADQCIIYFYILAAVTAAAILAPIKWPKSGIPLVIAVLLLGWAVVGMGGYIAYAGGRVRHREFRNGPPPVLKKPDEEH